MLKGLASGARAASNRRAGGGGGGGGGKSVWQKGKSAWNSRKGSALWADLGLGELKDDVGGGAGALEDRAELYDAALHFAPSDSVSRGHRDGDIARNAQGLLRHAQAGAGRHGGGRKRSGPPGGWQASPPLPTSPPMSRIC